MFAADDGVLAANNDDVRIVTKAIADIDPLTGEAAHPANEVVVKWQSEEHWAAVNTNLVHETTFMTTNRTTARAIKDAHELNLGVTRLFPHKPRGGARPS